MLHTAPEATEPLRAQTTPDNGFRVWSSEQADPLPLHGVFPAPVRAELPTPQQMLFTLRTVPLSAVLPRWQEHADRLGGGPVSLAIANDRDALLEPRLMAAATATETLHSLLGGLGSHESALPEADFALLTQRIEAAVDAAVAEHPHPHLRAHRRPVLELFHNRHRGPTPHTRLLDLATGLGEHAMPLFTGPTSGQVPPAAGVAAVGEVLAWAKATKHARNGIVHNGRAALDFEAATAALLLTTAVVEVLVLRELGMSEQRLAVLVHRQHSGLARRVREHLLPLLDHAPVTPQDKPGALTAVVEAVAGARNGCSARRAGSTASLRNCSGEFDLPDAGNVLPRTAVWDQGVRSKGQPHHTQNSEETLAPTTEDVTG
ncbi:HEPN domain-containing protein [Actinosynnema pretiosum]|uniref:Uncharacterized protein n=1 Tax=Actinosynnema pretiosum TaxID=42197 RepID=A0A290Z9U1_9PSEU|nr:HEPN domain-containing protein [Actinosynnema pretiosum]ATE55743.1 hypothetical protein CNX65_22665 [Actinosynnema pretiosum]